MPQQGLCRKGGKEAIYKAKENEDTGKEKAEEPQKKMKLSHSSSSTSMKFGTTVVPVAKQTTPLFEANGHFNEGREGWDGEKG